MITSALVRNSSMHTNAAHAFCNSATGGASPPLSIAERLIDDIRRALGHDRQAVQAGLARLKAFLDGDSVESETRPAYAQGGFAPWQERRLKSYIAANLTMSIRVETLAELISLSVSHFSRAFKKSFGMSPHAYVMRARIDMAKELMLSTRNPLSHIALACGLADQAHLTKLFRRSVGQPPSAWRRLHAEEI